MLLEPEDEGGTSRCVSGLSEARHSRTSYSVTQTLSKQRREAARVLAGVLLRTSRKWVMFSMKAVSRFTQDERSGLLHQELNQFISWENPQLLLRHEAGRGMSVRPNDAE